MSRLQLKDFRMQGIDVDQSPVDPYKSERPCSSEQGRFD